MDERSTGNGDSSMQMKCPCCGEMISMTASKSENDDESAEKQNMDMPGKDWSDDDFRQAMSPRNDEQPA